MHNRNIDRAIFIDLDKAINDVLNEHFDLYFDRKEATSILKRWWAKRMEKNNDRH